jgi:hypothetical protein
VESADGKMTTRGHPGVLSMAVSKDLSMRISGVLMAEAKTRVNRASVDAFFNSIDDEQKREDCKAIAGMMQQATKAKAEMWGTSIVGFGRHLYMGAGGRQAEWMEIALSPRKQNITLYLWPEFPGRDELLARLGNHSCGKGCVYIKRLSDVALPTLNTLIKESVKATRSRSPH